MAGLSALLGMPPGSNATGGDIAAALGASGAAATLPNCVQFVGTDGVTGSSPHIENGLFWNYSLNLGTKFCWEFWVRPGIGDAPAVASACDGYWVSTSTGGAHRLLIGLSSGGLPNNLWTISGNVLLDNAVQISYSTVDGIAAGEWAHVLVLADQDGGGNTQLQVFVNGLLFGGTQAFANGSGRQFASPGAGTGYNSLFVGHSDHQNAKCRLAALRAFDRANPLGGINSTFAPQRSFNNEWLNGQRASLLQVYAAKGTVPDLSDGYDRGSGTTLYHFPGKVTNGAGDGYPFPEFVNDALCPYGQGGELVNTRGLGSSANPLALPSLPVGAKLFDSFNRAPQSWVWSPINGPTVGASDPRASLGAVTPIQGMVGGGSPSPAPNGKSNVFEIVNGRLRCRAQQPAVIAWDSGSVVQDVRVTRIGAAPGGNATGAVIRCSDTNNFIGALIGANTGSNGTIFVADYQAGGNVLGFAQQFNPTNSAWTVLRLTVDVSNVVRLYVDNGAGGWEQWGSTYTDTAHTSATRVGCGANLIIASAGSWNADDFTAV